MKPSSTMWLALLSCARGLDEAVQRDGIEVRKRRAASRSFPSMPMNISALWVAALLTIGNAQAADPVIFNASVRVEVSANGKPLRVTAPAELPDAIRRFVEKRVATWHYQVTPRDGRVADVVTYVGISACALPTDEGKYRLAVDYRGNGPHLPLRLQLPAYPRAAVTQRKEGRIDVHLDVHEDGSATIERFEHKDGDTAPRALGFEPLIRGWVKTLEFEPELFDGKPVPAKGWITLDYRLPGSNSPRPSAYDEARASDACKVAAGENPTPPMAWDAAVKVTATAG